MIVSHVQVLVWDYLAHFEITKTGVCVLTDVQVM